MTTDNLSFYLQNRLIQTSQTGDQRYNDTFPFSIPWTNPPNLFVRSVSENKKVALGKCSVQDNIITEDFYLQTFATTIYKHWFIKNDKLRVHIVY